MKTDIEALKLVYDLNDKTIELGHSGPLIFESSGFSSAVTLFGHTVWDDEDYQAPYIDDGNTQMPLRDWFIQRIAEIKELVQRDFESLLKS